MSFPGSVFMEAVNIEAVYDACKGLKHMSSMNDICVISLQEAMLYLREQATYTPHSPGWVRLKNKPYKGDVAYVENVEPSIITTLLIIPRIPTNIYPTNEKRKRYDRPVQALFDPRTIRTCYGEESVKKRNISYLFKGDIYIDGFLRLETDEFIHDDTLPTREELVLFEKLPYIPAAFIQHTYNAIDVLALREGDHVLVMHGDLQGCFGVIESILLTDAQVYIPARAVSATIDSCYLRKDVRVGDEVKVTSGPNAGFIGWVVSVGEGDILVLYNHKIHLEVRVLYNMLPNLLTFS
jgi:ribosomal protein L24